MESRTNVPASEKACAVAWAGLCLGVVIVGALNLGCADHRISLQEFLQMQEQVGRAPATQPVQVPVAVIDKSLGPYRVGPGDVLSVTVVVPGQTEPTVPMPVRVNRKGEIDLPLAGSIKVAGLELEDVENAVREAFVPKVYRAAAVHVSVTVPETTNVLVIGAVTAPGLVQLSRTQRNLLFAIHTAGGATDLASGLVTLRRLRQPDKPVTLNIRDPEGLKQALTLPPLENGDIVTVHAATPNMVFVGGLVNAPQPQAYPTGVQMTVLQALAASGGLRTDVTPREATLIRRMPDGRDVHVKLNLDRIMKGKDPNITLAAGDILWVPDTLETRVQDWFNRNIFLRAGVVVTYNVTGVEFLNRRSLQGRSGGVGGTLEDRFDPFSFLGRSAALQGLTP